MAAKPSLDEQRDLCQGVANAIVSVVGIDQARWLAEELDIGIMVLAFTFQPGAMAYCSTAERLGMIEALKELTVYLESGMTTEPRGERGHA